MNDTRSQRLAAAAGILAAALMVAGFVLIGVDAPGPDATRTEILATYTDDATNARQALGVLLTGLGALRLSPLPQPPADGPREDQRRRRHPAGRRLCGWHAARRRHRCGARFCRVHGATLATRNVKDFHDAGIDLTDPWNAGR